jgi:hypothetical protein
MTDQFYLQFAKDRQAALLREAHNQTLGRRRPHGEPLVRFRLTIELKLGGHEHPMAVES